ncbi:31866_t:CDS:2 [Gigaspora margarita]|uniref:31866_t:CDS:1 n=1 Tax=Gigaspora margarita TaxID=4874 RepID=A0ABM8W657_GIGMA|nr:31866_t:CDS:2 [Gigaspora margarita]
MTELSIGWKKIFLKIFKHDLESTLETLIELRRVRFFSNIIQHAIGSLTDLELKKELQEVEELQEDQGVQESKKKGQDNLIFHVLSSQIPQRFSFPPSEQDAYVEPVLEHVEKLLFRFIVKHEQYIPYKTVENFISKCSLPKQTDANLLCILNFMIQNISVHTGSISNIVLWTIFIPPSEQDAYVEPVLEHVEKSLFRFIVKHEQYIPYKLWRTLFQNRKHEEEEECNVKRKYLSNIEYGEFTDFALYLVNKLEKNEEQIGQIARMAVAKNDILIDIWGSLITQKDENAKIKKFVALINFQFDMVASKNQR